VRWKDFEAMCPELADLGRRRLEERHPCLIGTLRADGSPRISPVEPYIVGGDVVMGMIAGSRKAADLLRDPRLVVHSIVTRWEADEGDFKLSGVAVPVPGPARRQALYEAMAEAHAWRELPADDPAYHVFRVEPVSAAYVRFEGSSWQDWTWDPKGGLRKRYHTGS
jgi:pyridoxamine 5'-phosphate oxidase-like protein